MRGKILAVLPAFVAMILVVMCGFSASTAAAATHYLSLDTLASKFAMRPVVARCYDDFEMGSPRLEGAWGYVDKPAKTSFLAIRDDLCYDALHVNDPSLEKWQRALAVMVLVHESYHLRRWGSAGNEAKVQCQAIRHWKVGARLLGAAEATVEDLWPYALVLHYEEVSAAKRYFDQSCQVPPLLPG